MQATTHALYAPTGRSTPRHRNDLPRERGNASARAWWSFGSIALLALAAAVAYAILLTLATPS